MHYPHSLIQAIWVKRHRRFILDVRLCDTGELVSVHCANTGSMLGINEPGAKCLLSKASGAKRRLGYTLEAVRAGRVWVGACPIRANTVGREAIEAGMIQEFGEVQQIQAEVRYGQNSRADLVVRNGDGARWVVEIKSASLAQGPVSLFPDAVTERGQKHLDELMAVVAGGGRAAMLFVAPRSDVQQFRPAVHIDPVYVAKLAQANAAGVLVKALRARVTRASMRADALIEVRLG